MPQSIERNRMSYDFQKDKQVIVDKWVKRYGSMDKAIFQMNGHIHDLKAQVEGKQMLLDELHDDS